MKLNSGQLVEQEENQQNGVKLATKMQSQQVSIKKSDFLSKREPVASRQIQNHSIISGHRDSSSNQSLNKSRRGRSHRKSRKQSQEGFQAQSNDRKMTLTSCSDILNRSIDDPNSIVQKPNVIVLQKELVNRSNQKMFDLANFIDNQQSYDQDSMSNHERNNSLEEFNQSAANHKSKINKVVYHRKDLDSINDDDFQEFSLSQNLQNDESFNMREKPSKTESKKFHKSSFLIQGGHPREILNQKQNVIYDYRIQNEKFSESQGGGSGTPQIHTMTSPLLPSRQQQSKLGLNASTIAHQQSEKQLHNLMSGGPNSLLLSSPRNEDQTVAPAPSNFTLNLDEKQKILSASKSFKTVFKMSQSGQKQASVNGSNYMALSGHQGLNRSHQQQNYLSNLNKVDPVEEELKIKLQNYNSQQKFENSINIPVTAASHLQVSKFRLPFDNNNSAGASIYPAGAANNQQIQPQNDKLPANSFLKEQNKNLMTVQNSYMPQQQSENNQQFNFDNSKYKNKYLAKSTAPSPPDVVPQLQQTTNILQAVTLTPSMGDAQSPRFTDLLKMNSTGKNFNNAMYRTHDQQLDVKIIKSAYGDVGPRERSVRSRKSNKSGKSGNSHKSGAKRKKNKTRAEQARNSEVKNGLKGRSQILGENGIEVDSLEYDQSFEKERNEQESSQVPLSIEKYSVIENMKSVVCKGDIKNSPSPEKLIQKQYNTSKQVLMHILESPDKVENDQAKQYYETTIIEIEDDALTFKDPSAVTEQIYNGSSQVVVSEHGSESKSSVKTPLSKSKSIKEKSSLKSKKKKKSKQKSEKKNKIKDDQSIKSKKQQLKMFISGNLSMTQKISNQVTDYKIHGEDFDELDDGKNQIKLMNTQQLTQNDHIKELETFREGYNDETHMERSQSSFHDQMYQSLCMKKPQDSFPISSNLQNDDELMEDGIQKNKTQPLIERMFTEPCIQPFQSNMHYSNMKPVQNYSDQKTLKRKSRINGSNQNENSDFGSSDGTNIHFNFPNTIHELISPGDSNCTNTKLRNSVIQNKMPQKDQLQEDSRNETTIFQKGGKNRTTNQKQLPFKSQDKKSLTGTQKISFNHQKLDVSKSPYKRSFNCSIAEEIQPKSVTSTPGKTSKQKMKKHRMSCIDDLAKTSPIVHNKLKIAKEDSSSARYKIGPQTTTNNFKSKRYQTLRQNEFHGHLSKSLTNHRHLQSTSIIKQMKLNAKENGRALSGIRKVNQNSISSPSNGLKNSLCKDQMSKNDGDENVFDDNSCKLEDQYSKIITVKERDMNNRTFSGPIIYQMNSENEGQNKQSNDSLLRQISKDKKQLSKNESQPLGSKDYLKMGKQSNQIFNQTITQRSSKLLHNQPFNVQSTSSSTLLSTKTPNKGTINKLFNTQTDGLTFNNNRRTQGPSSKNTNYFQSSHGSTSTERDNQTSKVKALSLDRQCVQQPLASLENIKEQDDEMDQKNDQYDEEEQVSEDSRSQQKRKQHFAVENNGEDEEHQLHKVKKLVAFTERSTILNKSPFDDDLSQLENQMEKTIPMSPKERTNKKQSPQKQAMGDKQKSQHSLITTKNITSSKIEYTQRILNSSQMIQVNRSSLRNKRISYGNCLSNQNTQEELLKLNPSKTYSFQKPQTSQQPAQRHQTNTINQHQKLIGNKSSGFCPPSLKEILKTKNTNLNNINSIRSSKNTSAQNTSKILREPDSALSKIKIKEKDLGQKKSDFIQCYSNNQSANKKGSGQKQQKSISKRELLSMSVLSENRNGNTTNQGCPSGTLLREDTNEPNSSLQKTERRAALLQNSSSLHNSTRRKGDTTRISTQKPQSQLDRKVSQDNLARNNKKPGINAHKQKTMFERNKSPRKLKDAVSSDYRDFSSSQFLTAKRQKQAAVSIGRQDRNKTNIKAFNQIMKDSRDSQRQHYSNLYSKQGQSHVSVGTKTMRKDHETIQTDGKESKEELIADQQIQNGKQNNITERKLYYQLEQQKNSGSNKKSESLEKQSEKSKEDDSNNNKEQYDSAKMNKHGTKKKSTNQFKRKQSLVSQQRGALYQNVQLSNTNIGEFDPYHHLSGRNSRDQQLRTPGQMQYLIAGGRNSLTKELSKEMYTVQGIVTSQTPSTAPSAIASQNNKNMPNSERLIQKNNQNNQPASSELRGGEQTPNELEQSFEMQQQQNMNQLKKKHQIQLQPGQNMDKHFIDQMMQINTSSSHSNRQKPQTSKNKPITQPVANSNQREPIFSSHLISNGGVPNQFQERVMKEAVLNEHRGSHKQQAIGFNNLYTHKMMSDHNVTAASVTYTTSGGGMSSQMKSHQSQMSKKQARADNTSIGPTSKFKSSTKVSNLATHGASIKHAYGYGGGVLSSSNQNVQMRSHYPQGSNKLNSTSMVRQKTEIMVTNNIGPPQQKTPITQMQGHPNALGHNFNMNAGGGGAVKEKKQSFAQLLQPYEKEKFGDRCPLGFKKKGILGKGGIAIVWLAEIKEYKRYGYSEEMVGMRVALKQFPKVKGAPIDSSAKIEIETGNTLFPLEVKEGTDGEKDEDFVRGYAVDEKEHPGILSIARLIDQIEDKQDVWLVYEVGAQCLGKELCDVKGEFYKGERIYRIMHQDFYQILMYNHNILRTLIIKIAEAFDVLSRFGIVHSDIKPDNILIQMNENGSDIENIKLIDFGSAFQFHNVTQISATTPEYLAPEILNYLEDRNKNSKSINTAISLSQRSWPWSFDVWSLGIILLEIVSGCPIWMSLKCRVQTIDGKSVLGQGILGVAQRDQKKIVIKQQQLIKNIPGMLRKFECYGLDRDIQFMDLLHQMLTPDPSKRISPIDIINHPFCQYK